MRPSVYTVKINGLPIGHFDAFVAGDMAMLNIRSQLSQSERDNLSEIEAAIRADLSKAARHN